MAKHVAPKTAQGVLDELDLGVEHENETSEIILDLAVRIKDQLEELAGYLTDIDADNVAPEDLVSIVS